MEMFGTVLGLQPKTISRNKDPHLTVAYVGIAILLHLISAKKMRFLCFYVFEAM